MADSGTIHAGRTLAGRYTLRRLIDKGGMAEVWEGEDSVLGRAVAIKVLYPHLAHDASFSERFRLEAIAAARLAHPNVVGTYDTGIDEGLAFIVMELVDGHTLRHELADGPLPPALARDIAAQVADALDYAHGAGIVHRDIKPANILLCPDGRAKVADFGIAKAALGDGEPARDLTGTGAIIGTAKYLSPEQVDGRRLDGRSDVYALGVVLYEMLCGRPPFIGDTDMAIGIQHLSSRPASPRSMRPEIPPTLEAVVMKALEKSPADRYPSAAAMHAALVQADAGGVAAGAPDATRLSRPPERPHEWGPAPEVDDARPMVVRDDTPPGGSAIVMRRRSRRWVLPSLMAALVIVTLGVAGVLIARSGLGSGDTGGGGGSGGGGGGGAGEQVAVRRALPFDPPPGSGAEHDDELPFLFDGDPATAWTTENYSNRQFGGLKPGVGFVLQLDGSRRLDELRLTTASSGWSAEVLVAEAVRPTREEWGQPVDTETGIGPGSVRFDLGGRTGAAVLVWITDLGAGNMVAVSEVQVTS